MELAHIQQKDRDNGLKEKEREVKQREKKWKEKEYEDTIMKQRTEELKRKLDALVDQNTNVLKVVEVNQKEVDIKMKDVRSILLQNSLLPRVDPTLVKMLENIEMTQKNMEKNQKMIRDTGHENSKPLVREQQEIMLKVDEHLQAVLDDHEARTRQTVIMSGVVMAVILLAASKTF